MSVISSINARRYVDRAMHVAGERQASIAVVVVDPAGTIIAAARTDGTAPIMVELAQRKAALSAAIGVPTHVAVKIAAADPVMQAGLLSVREHLLLPGGMPVIGPLGVPEGAVGIAGGHYDLDQQIVEATVRTDVAAST